MKGLDLTRETVSSLSALVRKKEISPVELTRATLERIASLDGALQAFVTVMESQAIESAREAEQAVMAGRYLGPFHGIPVAVKDLYYTKGVPTMAGSRVLSGFIPEYDATAVTRLKSAGAVIVGKTNTHEFAFGYVTSPTRNPWDLSRIPGGSSGGSGAAVAASLCFAATGTDTGGSIRVPAAMNGIVGLKPTFGRVSKYGVVTLSWTLDHAGPMTRSVRDAALMMNILAGHDPLDASSADVPVPDFTQSLDGALSGLRLGIPREHFIDPLDPEVSKAYRDSIDVLKRLGAEVREVSLPNAGLAPLAAVQILLAEASAYHEKWHPSKSHLYTPEVDGFLKMGKLIPATQYIKAQRIRTLVCNDFDAAFREVDALAVPALPITAPVAGETEVAAGPVRAGIGDLCGRNMFPLTMAGLPAITVPCGFSGAGLPIGLQIIGRAFDESKILQIAHQYETSTEWHLRRPPV